MGSHLGFKKIYFKIILIWEPKNSKETTTQTHPPKICEYEGTINVTDWSLMACQPVNGYFIPIG